MLNTLDFAEVNLAREILRFNYPELWLLIKHDLIARVQLVPVLNQRRRGAPLPVSPSEPHPWASLLPCSGMITGSLKARCGVSTSRVPLGRASSLGGFSFGAVSHLSPSFLIFFLIP